MNPGSETRAMKALGFSAPQMGRAPRHASLDQWAGFRGRTVSVSRGLANLPGGNLSLRSGQGGHLRCTRQHAGRPRGHQETPVHVAEEIANGYGKRTGKHCPDPPELACEHDDEGKDCRMDVDPRDLPRAASQATT